MKKRSLMKPWFWVTLFACGCVCSSLACDPKPAEEKPAADASSPDARAEAAPAEPGAPDAKAPEPRSPEPTPTEPKAEPGPPEAGTPDAGTPDAGTPEPSPPEAGKPEPGPREMPPESGTPDGPIQAGACQSKDPKCAAGYLCRDDASPPTCHLQCDPEQPNRCPGGVPCQVLSSGEGICVKGAVVKEKQKCDLNNICGQGLVCVLSSAGSTSGTCYRRCTLKSLSSCPSGSYCFLVHSRNGVCLAGSGGSKDPDADCQRSDECKPGLVCFTPTGQKSRCATLCDDKTPCRAGTTCRELKGAPKASGACVK